MNTVIGRPRNLPGGEDRWLWPHIDKGAASGHWLWTGTVNPKGYGRVRVDNVQTTVHRYVYGLLVEPAAEYILHRCGVRRCCNPSHLYEGDAKQNAKDRDDDGTTPWGETHGGSKLTADQVRAIRDDSRPQAAIAEEYGISQQHVSRLQCGIGWDRLRD